MKYPSHFCAVLAFLCLSLTYCSKENLEVDSESPWIALAGTYNGECVRTITTSNDLSQEFFSWSMQLETFSDVSEKVLVNGSDWYYLHESSAEGERFVHLRCDEENNCTELTLTILLNQLSMTSEFQNGDTEIETECICTRLQ